MKKHLVKNTEVILHKLQRISYFCITSVCAAVMLGGCTARSPLEELREGFQTPPSFSCVKLDLGEVMVLADVKVNGQPAGGVWTFPYSLDITRLVKEGENTMEVTVYNNWRNRLIADEALPVDQRGTWTNIQPRTASDELQPSGLLGPVTINIQ